MSGLLHKVTSATFRSVKNTTQTCLSLVAFGVVASAPPRGNKRAVDPGSARARAEQAVQHAGTRQSGPPRRRGWALPSPRRARMQQTPSREPAVSSRRGWSVDGSRHRRGCRVDISWRPRDAARAPPQVRVRRRRRGHARAPRARARGGARHARQRRRARAQLGGGASRVLARVALAVSRVPGRRGRVAGRRDGRIRPVGGVSAPRGRLRGRAAPRRPSARRALGGHHTAC